MFLSNFSLALTGMDSRTETDVREEQARRADAGLSERAGDVQQQV